MKFADYLFCFIVHIIITCTDTIAWKANLWNVKRAQATAFIFDSQMGVLVKASNIWDRKCFDLGPVSIKRLYFPGMGIPMLKIRRSRDRLIFNTGIPLRVRRYLYIETAPWWEIEPPPANRHTESSNLWNIGARHFLSCFGALALVV